MIIITSAHHFKLIISNFLEFTSSILGETHKITLSLILLMIIDTIFGWIKGFKNNNWRSKKAKWGIAGKLTELILIALLYIVNWIFQVKFIVYIGLYYFIACEVASILENYTRINKNLPNGLIDALKKLQFNIGSYLVNGIKDSFDKNINNKNNPKH